MQSLFPGDCSQCSLPAGHEALEVLKKGSVLRKKWLETNDAAEAQQSQKTERLIRCRVENNRVVLHYYHQVSFTLKIIQGKGFPGLSYSPISCLFLRWNANPKGVHLDAHSMG